MEPHRLFIAVFQHMSRARRVAIAFFGGCVLIGRDKLLHKSEQSVELHLIGLENHGSGSASLLNEPHQDVLRPDHMGPHILRRFTGKNERLLGFFRILCHLFSFLLIDQKYPQPPHRPVSWFFRSFLIFCSRSVPLQAQAQTC